jgi:hypothetical protein
MHQLALSNKTIITYSTHIYSVNRQSKTITDTILLLLRGQPCASSEWSQNRRLIQRLTMVRFVTQWLYCSMSCHNTHLTFAYASPSSPPDSSITISPWYAERTAATNTTSIRVCSHPNLFLTSSSVAASQLLCRLHLFERSWIKH